MRGRHWEIKGNLVTVFDEQGSRVGGVTKKGKAGGRLKVVREIRPDVPSIAWVTDIVRQVREQDLIKTVGVSATMGLWLILEGSVPPRRLIGAPESDDRIECGFIVLNGRECQLVIFEHLEDGVEAFDAADNILI